MNRRGQGLAEIIVICVIVLFIALVSIRVMKKKAEVPADLNPVSNAGSSEGASDTTSASPSELVQGAKEKMEQTKRTIPDDLREDDSDTAEDDSSE